MSYTSFNDFNRAIIVTALHSVAHKLRTGEIPPARFNMSWAGASFDSPSGVARFGCIGVHLGQQLGLTEDDASKDIHRHYTKAKLMRHPLSELFWGAVLEVQDPLHAADRIDAWCREHGEAEELVQ